MPVSCSTEFLYPEHQRAPVFRPDPDTALLHLAHPMFHRALAAFARKRFPGSALDEDATRWTVRRGDVPAGADALLLLTVEEMAANDLRETFHHWTRTVRFRFWRQLGAALDHVPAIGCGVARRSIPPTSPSRGSNGTRWSTTLRTRSRRWSAS